MNRKEMYFRSLSDRLVQSKSRFLAALKLKSLTISSEQTGTLPLSTATSITLVPTSSPLFTSTSLKPSVYVGTSKAEQSKHDFSYRYLVPFWCRRYVKKAHETVQGIQKVSVERTDSHPKLQYVPRPDIKVDPDSLRLLRKLDRSVGILLGLISSIDDGEEFRKDYPDLSSKFDKIIRLLSEIQHMDPLGRRQLRKAIKKLPKSLEYSKLIRPLQESDILECAKHKPVIVLHTSRHQLGKSCAVIIREMNIKSISLPEAEYTLLRRWAKKFPRGPPDVQHQILQGLWDKVMKPILDELGMVSVHSEGSRWPQMYLIPTGPLCLLPIHAAGYYADNEGRCVLDRVAPTYSTSLRVLCNSLSANDNEIHKTETGMKFLPVAADLGIKERPLPGVKREIECVENLVRIHRPHWIIEKIDAKTGSLMDALQNFGPKLIFHFAGHGSDNQGNAGLHSLLLNDGGEVDVGKLLNLRSLRRDGNGPLSVFLSGCSTSCRGNIDFCDEHLSLVGAFNSLGTLHTIGYQFVVKDDLCVEIANDIYKSLLGDDITDESFALAVHKAVRKARDDAYSSQRVPFRKRQSRAFLVRDFNFKRRRADYVDPMIWIGPCHTGR